MRMRATFGLVAMARSSVRCDGQDFESRGCQTFRLSSYRRGAPIDLAKEVRHVVGNHVNDMKPERLRGWKAHGRAYRLCCPVRIATIELGEAVDIGHGIVNGLTRLSIRRLPCGSLLLAIFLCGGVVRVFPPGRKEILPAVPAWPRQYSCQGPCLRQRWHKRCRCRRWLRARRSARHRWP